MKPFIRNIVFFSGWLLSPLTFWNDVFVNIPISYLAACALVGVMPINFAVLMLISYWLSNILGLYMMYASGSEILKSREDVGKKLSTIFGAMAVYSVIIYALYIAGILKPL